MLDITRVKQQMLEKGVFDDILDYLLPNGKIIGTEYCVGSLDGEVGTSLKICMKGEKIGKWADFSSGRDESGDVLDLWFKVRGRRNAAYSFMDAYTEISEYLGETFTPKRSIADHVRSTEVFNVPSITPEQLVCDQEGLAEVQDYLLATRKLSIGTLTAYRVRAVRGTKEPNIGQPMFMVPAFAPTGDLACMWFLGISRDENGKHRAGRHPSNARPTLVGWQSILPADRHVVLCEGFVDAMTWNVMGVPALSLPNGVRSHAWIEHDLRALARFERVYLHLDNDAAGARFRSDIAVRLGTHRTYIVPAREGLKDANDWAKADVPREEFHAALHAAAPAMPPLVVSIRDVWDDVLKELYPAEEGGEGFRMPWEPDDKDAQFKLMIDDLSIAAGSEKVGKSEIAQNLAIHIVATSDTPVAIASMEFPPSIVYAWLIECATGYLRSFLDPRMATRARDWVHDRIHVIKANDGFSTKQCVDTFEWLRAVKGVKYFLADSLTTFEDVDETDLKQQIRAIKLLSKLPGELHAHITLAAHFRKKIVLSTGKRAEQNREDIRGASALKDLAPTIMVITRNWEKQKKVKAIIKEHPPSEERRTLLREVWRSEPDKTIRVDAHRRTGADPEYHVWWNSCRQYTSIPDENAIIRYVQ